MKNTLVRISVLALAFTGFAASSIVSHSQSSAAHKLTASTTDCVPACLPSDPNHCGLR